MANRKRDTEILIRVTKEEKALIVTLANAVGMGVSEYLRHLLAGIKK